jgi:hypothetical protein
LLIVAAPFAPVKEPPVAMPAWSGLPLARSQ